MFSPERMKMKSVSRVIEDFVAPLSGLEVTEGEDDVPVGEGVATGDVGRETPFRSAATWKTEPPPNS